MKLCSHSLIFVPDALTFPIIRLPYVSPALCCIPMRSLTVPCARLCHTHTHPHRYSATQKIEADARALWGKEEGFVVKSSLYVEMRESNKNAPYNFKEVRHIHLS